MTNQSLYNEEVQQVADGNLSPLGLVLELKNSEDLENDLMQMLLEVERISDWGENGYLCDLYDLLRIIQQEIVFGNLITDIRSANIHTLVAFTNLLLTPGLAIEENSKRAHQLLIEILAVEPTNEYAKATLGGIYIANFEGIPRDPKRAYDLFLDVIQTRPDYGFALANLGELLRLGDSGVKKDTQAAYHYLQRAVESDPSNLSAHISLGKLFRNGSESIAQDLKRSLHHYTAVYNIDPYDIPAMIGIAELLTSELDGVPYNPERSQELIKEVLSMNPNNVAALTIYGENLGAIGDIINGRQAIEKALSIDPTYAYAFTNLGKLYLTGGKDTPRDLSRALFCFEKAYELDSTDLVILNNLADVYRRTCNFQKALEIAEKSLQIEQNQPYPWWEIAKIHQSSPELRDLAKAKDCFEKALSIDPNCYHALIELGVLLINDDYGITKDPKRAYELLTKALEIDAENSYLFNNLADLLYLDTEVRNVALALEYVKKALSIETNDSRSHSLLAHIIIQEGMEQDFYLAYEHLEQAVALEPDHTWPAYYLIRILIHGIAGVEVNLDRALSLIQYHVERNPNDLEFLELREICLFKMKEQSGRMSILQKIKKILY